MEKIHEVIEELRTEVNMYFTTDKILEVSGEMSEALFEEKKRTSIIKSNGIRSTEQSRNDKAAGPTGYGTILVIQLRVPTPYQPSEFG